MPQIKPGLMKLQIKNFTLSNVAYVDLSPILSAGRVQQEHVQKKGPLLNSDWSDKAPLATN